MELALQPVRRNLHAKPPRLSLSICAQRPPIDSTISAAVSVSPLKFLRHDPAIQSATPVNPFRINTCKSVSKQRTLSSFRINTCEKRGRGLPNAPHRASAPRMRQFARPLFSYSYELLFPQTLCFHNHPHCPGVWGPAVSDVPADIQAFGKEGRCVRLSRSRRVSSPRSSRSA